MGACVRKVRPMTEHFLKTSRLYLRQFTPQDLPLLLELDSDPEVMRYINGGTSLQVGYLQHTVLPHLLSQYGENGCWGYWATYERATHAYIGWHYMLPVGDSLETADLGYRLKRASWGKGYATELSRALVALAFRRPDIRCVEATAMAANGASIRVMEKAGLQFAEHYSEESFPGDDKRAVRYRITREQYESIAPAPAYTICEKKSDQP